MGTSCLVETFYKHAAFSTESRLDPGPQTKQDQINQKLLYEALFPTIQVHKYPKMKIDISVIVLEDDGGALAAAVNCASLALANAGLEMYDFAAAVSFGIGDADDANSIIIDPVGAGEADATLAYMPSIGQVSLFEITKSAGEKVVERLLEQTQKYAQEIYRKQISVV